MQKLFVILIASLLLTGCGNNSTGLTVISPLSVIVDTPRSLMGSKSSGGKLTPEVIKVAQEHCDKENRDAVLEKSWIVAFDRDYFQFECKKNN